MTSRVHTGPGVDFQGGTMGSRRTFLQAAVTAVVGLGGASRVFGTNSPPVGTHSVLANPWDRLTVGVLVLVITPGLQYLPFTREYVMKVFQLIVPPVKL